MRYRADSNPHSSKCADNEMESLLTSASRPPVSSFVPPVSFSIVFNNYVTLTDAVRVGARTLAVSRSVGSASTDACQLAQTSVQQAAFNLNQSLLTVPTPTVTVSCTNLTAGSQATLKATYPCDLTIIGINTAPGCTLSSQTTVRIE
jgi:Flp pilus assembly protein TadG